MMNTSKTEAEDGPPLRFRRCVLHIGTEKTGSTSVQAFLAANRAGLLREGVFVPAALARDAALANHERLATYAMDQTRLDDDLRATAGVLSEQDVWHHRAAVEQALRAEVARLPSDFPLDAGTMLLSNEHCHSRLHTAEEVERIAALLQPLAKTVEILVYIRPQHELAASLYDQALRVGYCDIPIMPDFSGRTQRVVHRGYFDYAQLLERWSAVFGRGAVTVRIFGARELTDGNVVRDMVAWLGLRGAALTFPRNSNASMPARSQMVMNAVNRLARQRGSKLAPAVRHGLIGQLQRAASGPPLKPSRADAEAFFESFAQSNERVRRDWFATRPRLFEPDFADFPERPTLPDETLALAEAAVGLQETINALRQRLIEAGIAPPA